MKKILLSLVALMLSATAANAQFKMMENGLKASATVKAVPSQNPVLQGGKIVSNPADNKAMAPSKKKETFDLTDDQRYLGNDNALNPYYAVGLPGVNATKGGVYLDRTVLQKYAGARIIGMRFILAQPLGATHCSLVEVSDYSQTNGNFVVGDEKASADLATTTAVDQESGDWNWNMVKFDTPYTIPATPTDIIFGFTYKQKSTTDANGNYTNDCYPFFTSQTGTAGGFCIYATADGVTGWYPMSLNGSWVDLCAQVIIERDGGFIEDIELGALSAQKFVHNGSPIQLAFSCRNTGSKTLKDYQFGISLDGEDLATTNPGQELGGEYTAFQVPGIKLPEGIEDGAHLLTLYVKSMNGTTPTGDLSNDTLYSVLRVYTDCLPAHQKQLVEHFTGQGCMACPYGYDVLNNMVASRNDLAWVAIHNYQAQEGDDEYVIPESAYITSYSINSMPSASFNRYLFANEDLNPSYKLAIGIGYDDNNMNKAASQTFSQVVDLTNQEIPAIVRIDLTQQFDLNNNELNLTVHGTGLKNAAKILQGTRLTVYLTEDGQVSDQYYGNGTYRKMKHDHILRAIATNPGGDNITWKGDNFEMTYTIPVDEDYDFSKMHAIAFVNNPFVEFSADGKQYGFYRDTEDAWVNNCNMIDFSEEETTGISTVAPAENKTVVARYAADGTQLSAPVKGINIVKYSDGTTNTVIVK